MSQESLGQLYLLTTPIGNLDDMTFRAVKTLQQADLIAAEDTRRAGILLKHFDIKCKTTSYHMHNEKEKTSYLIQQVKEGKKVVVLSDAGTPVISDPGFLAVREAVNEGIEPNIIPGVCALTFAAVACAFPLDSFTFAAFLPAKAGKRKVLLEKYLSTGLCTFFYESPYKIDKLLNDINDICGPNTPVALVREATKMYEETIRGSVSELIELGKDKRWRGEFVVAVNMREADHIILDEPKKNKKNYDRFSTNKTENPANLLPRLP
ncbi:16S rRNA (cytidine(1402)-2'-O)-methyltransferase [Lentisphaera profundi]|uniref:Ribosomal RNA small subunit methyltransferase I n=1 Tax=Lentisphaera profundi TaxID=1658616 RepID=A0ABY7VVB5_9BACT|nr:16S rRNA (cytidine(1402)-2'-O)-methyltransferase [Lentisphaera profundi]WDE98012.1 16S rRNA (cytidine(1402)-2'-O)-methyltransferase [Lentisphaera profundi]